MDVLATGLMSGHEARGSVRIIAVDDARTVELDDLWVAPGPPDVRLFVRPHRDGTIDSTSTELGLVPDGETALRRPFPEALSAGDARSVVIYCRVFSVLFGHAELDWLI